MNQEITNEILQLSEFVKGVSPLVWDALLFQQSVVFVCQFVSFVFGVVCGLFGLYLLKKRPKWSLDIFGDCYVGGVFGIVGCAVTGIAMFALVIDGLPRLLNPVYYAVKTLAGG